MDRYHRIFVAWRPYTRTPPHRQQCKAFRAVDHWLQKTFCSIVVPNRCRCSRKMAGDAFKIEKNCDGGQSNKKEPTPGLEPGIF